MTLNRRQFIAGAALAGAAITSGAALLRARPAEALAQRIEQQDIDAWFELDAAELLGDDAADQARSEPPERPDPI